jgi:hypothetical protein
VNGKASFTDLGFLLPAEGVRLLFTCESCQDAGSKKLDITAQSVTFNIQPALHHLKLVYPSTSGAKVFQHPVVAGEVKKGLINTCCLFA